MMLVSVYGAMEVPDYIGLTRCLAHLNDAAAVVDIFNRLLEGPRDDLLMAFQVAFDLVENTTQAFLTLLLNLLSPSVPSPPADAAAPVEASDTSPPWPSYSEPASGSLSLQAWAR